MGKVIWGTEGLWSTGDHQGGVAEQESEPGNVILIPEFLALAAVRKGKTKPISPTTLQANRSPSKRTGSLPFIQEGFFLF